MFYTAPANHDAEMLAKFVDSRGRNGTVNVQSPIPYPVNEITIFWEYLKKDLTQERVFFMKFVRWLRQVHPDSPILTKIIDPNMLDA